MMNVVVLKRDGVVLVERVELATTAGARMRGLLGQSSLAEGEGMYLAPCNAIHTWFMKFAIDLVFLDRDLRVVRVVRDVRPWRMASGGRGAHGVVEVASGWLPEDWIEVGDRLELVVPEESGPNNQ